MTSSVAFALLALTGAAAQATTCGEVKSVYRDSECCGKPAETELAPSAQEALEKALEPGAVCFTGCSPYTDPPFPTWSSMVQNMASQCELLVHVRPIPSCVCCK
eukprot:6210719-Pleurochrysis_carterae.AAC.5